jgi:uncharacterized protein YndB with AHSA1/START domain
VSAAASVKPFETSRVFDVSRDKMWKAWTEEERMKQWWGPKGFKVTKLRNDLRPGGTMHYCLRMPDGGEMWGKFAYREVVKEKKLVFINSFSDAEGGTTRHPMNPGWPLEMHTTITFEDAGPNRTKVTVVWIPAEGSSDSERKTFDDNRASMTMGWGGTMEMLGAYLSSAK